MLEVARIIGALSAVLLVVAVAAWVKLAGGPVLQRLKGRAVSNSSEAEFASRLVVLALGLSVVAAVLAVYAWIAN